MKSTLPIIILVSLAGCTAFTQPPVRDANAALSPPAQFTGRQSAALTSDADLLTLFDDPVLTAVTQRALENNLDIRAASLRMEQAGFTVGLAKAGQVPKLDGALRGSRAGADGGVVGAGSASLDASWELDIWGKLRDGTGAARADAEAAAEQFRFARVSIASQTMQGWFEYCRATQAVELERQRLDGLKQREDLVRRNYRAGVGNLDDLAAIRRDVALSNEVLIANKSTQSNAARLLQILLGAYPDGTLTQRPRLPALKAAPKAGIPANVLAERPDLRAAWQRVVAADRRISVAQKNLLPSFSLTGSFGSQSADFSRLLNGATIWSLAGNLTAPVFDGGRRQTEVLASRNRADQAWVAYLQAALQAFSEVEHALEQETQLRRREAELRKAVKHAQTTSDLFETRYQAGLANILDVLNAENAVFDIREQLLTVRKARLNNRVALALSLGKGV